jgi:hypothetical protein
MSPFKHIHMAVFVVSFRGKNLHKDITNMDRRIKDERNDIQRNRQRDRLDRWTEECMEYD